MEHETQVRTSENHLKNTQKLSERQMGYILLRKQGMSVADAAKETPISIIYTYLPARKVPGNPPNLPICP